MSAVIGGFLKFCVFGLVNSHFLYSDTETFTRMLTITQRTKIIEPFFSFILALALKKITAAARHVTEQAQQS